MGASDAESLPDAEFVAFVSARQHALLRAAFLVCGDLRVAEDVVRGSLVRLAREWSRLRDERPDTEVRRVLYRDAVASWRRRRPRGAVDDARWAGSEDARWAGPDDPPWEGHDDPPWAGPDDRDEEGAEDVERRRAVLRALDTLTARQRAAVVLRFFDDRSEPDVADVLGVSPEAARALADEAARALADEAARALADEAASRLRVALSADLRDLLELASDEVPDVDLAEDAWDAAQRDRRLLRRRVLFGAGAVAAAGVAAAVVTRDPGARPVGPRVSPSATPTRLTSAVVGGVTVDLAPDPEAEPSLAPYSQARTMRLPPRLGFDDWHPMPKLGPTTGHQANEASVRAVLLASLSAPDRTVIPVIHTPRGTEPYLALPDVVLRPVTDEDGNPGRLLDPRTISDDRRRLVFPQPGAVVVADARDGTAAAVDVPDQHLLHAGWARDGHTVVAWGHERSWTVDVDTLTVDEVDPGPVRPGWVDLHTAPDGTTSLRSYSGAGRYTGSRGLRGAVIYVVDGTVSNTEGWGASAAYLGPTYIGAISRHQGLVAVQGDLRPIPRVLAASTGSAVPREEAFRPLVWGPQDVVLLESRSFPGGPTTPVARVLAWDVIGGTLTMVTEVAPVRDGDGGFTGDYVL